jgi:hypothetical protein
LNGWAGKIADEMESMTERGNATTGKAWNLGCAGATGKK